MVRILRSIFRQILFAGIVAAVVALLRGTPQAKTRNGKGRTGLKPGARRHSARRATKRPSRTSRHGRPGRAAAKRHGRRRVPVAAR